MKTCRADVARYLSSPARAREEVFWSLAVSVIVLLTRHLLVRIFSVAKIVDYPLG
jgi:hypothetical protein